MSNRRKSLVHQFTHTHTHWDPQKSHSSLETGPCPDRRLLVSLNYKTPICVSVPATGLAEWETSPRVSVNGKPHSAPWTAHCPDNHIMVITGHKWVNTAQQSKQPNRELMHGQVCVHGRVLSKQKRKPPLDFNETLSVWSGQPRWTPGGKRTGSPRCLQMPPASFLHRDKQQTACLMDRRVMNGIMSERRTGRSSMSMK